MKRSEINRAITEAQKVIAENRFALPPFADWGANDWCSLGDSANEIRKCRMGWDVTDLGTGRFDQVGCVLFTLRNGRWDDLGAKRYAEKIIVMRPGQEIPWHFHFRKTEDIIRRGGGAVRIELCNSDAEAGFADSDVTVSCDGIIRTVPARGAIVLQRGESITLRPGVYHRFVACADEATFLGEVSDVNDDSTDNHFYNEWPRYPEIEEDEPPMHYLCTEYPQT